MKLMDCPKCGGSGKVVDPRQEGEALRSYRIGHAVSLRAMAKLLKVTPAYLSDIELGRRGGEGQWMAKYAFALRGVNRKDNKEWNRVEREISKSK